MSKYNAIIITLFITFSTFKNFAQTTIRIDSNTLLRVIGKDSTFIDQPESENLFFGEKATNYYKGDMHTFLKKNLQYPKDAHQNKIEGIVKISAQLDNAGNLHSIKLVHSIYPSIDAEAIRLVKNMSDWRPSKSNNNTTLFIEIPFKL